MERREDVALVGVGDSGGRSSRVVVFLAATVRILVDRFGVGRFAYLMVDAV